MSSFLFVKLLKITIGPVLLFLWWMGDKKTGLERIVLKVSAVLLACAPLVWGLASLYADTGFEFFPLIATVVLVPALGLGIPCYLIGKRRGSGLLS